jgi:hypothetical protein
MPATYVRPQPWLTVDHPVPPPPIRFTGLDHEQHGDVCPANRAGSLSDERRLGRSTQLTDETLKQNYQDRFRSAVTLEPSSALL